MTAENQKNPLEAAPEIQRFRSDVARVFKNSGSAIVGCDGDLLLIAFGSPLERSALHGMKKEMPYEDDAHTQVNHTPIAKAVGFINDIMNSAPEARNWYLGLDTGEVVFAWSELTGYSAFGPPVVRARILSNLAPRYKTRVLLTERVIEKIEGLPIRRLDTLAQQDQKEPFYELIRREG
jgi:class 3 adenylate cyclase